MLDTFTAFDTHTHLNFKRFRKNVDEIITQAKAVGVEYMVVPGTDLGSSRRAIEIAEQYDGIYAAVGVHPHHSYSYPREVLRPSGSKVNFSLISDLESLLQSTASKATSFQ